MSKIFFIGCFLIVWQVGSLLYLILENSEWCNNDKFYVMFILEDVVVIIVLVWNIGVVVIFGKVQFEYGVFGMFFLQGIDCIQIV